MVNVARLIFSLSIHKTAKKAVRLTLRQLIEHWHTHCQKGDTEAVVMKKGLITIFCLLVLTVTAIPAGAQTRYRRSESFRTYQQRLDDSRYRNRAYSGSRYRWDRDRSFWDRHRDKLTTGIGAGAGAAVGAAVGGKRGAILGAIIGGGGAAIYTYGIRDKERRRRY
jgi:hypothetical protein